jgi:hypothetical protein
LRDILQQTRLGKQVDSAQIRKPRFVIDQKQTAVADKPSLAGQWRNIDNQLAVVEWWNRYSELQKKAQGNATSHRRALSSEISGSEDTGNGRSRLGSEREWSGFGSFERSFVSNRGTR